MRCDYIIVILFFNFLVLKAQRFFPKDLAKKIKFPLREFMFFPNFFCHSNVKVCPNKNKVAT